MNIYCTLFDSNYLDKGMVLYRSLCECEENFRLYVFAFDDRCRDILRQEAPEHMVVVSLQEFESPELLAVKPQRTRAEYCWTCTPWTIRYVLEHYGEPMCTYIDADMMFYSSPQYIFNDMRAKGCSVLITPHRLNRSSPRMRRQEQHIGTYCVEFNTFLNDEPGREALHWWSEKCLEWCFYTPDVDAPAYGDQKYLNEFPTRFSGVCICEEWGAGMAGWNAGQLRLVPGKEVTPVVEVRATGKQYPAVFFHFAGITYLTRTLVNTNSGISDPALHKALCDPYIAAIREVRAYLLKQYEIELYMRRTVTDRKLYAFYQRYLSPLLHLRRLSDVYRIA